MKGPGHAGSGKKNGVSSQGTKLSDLDNNYCFEERVQTHVVSRENSAWVRIYTPSY